MFLPNPVTQRGFSGRWAINTAKSHKHTSY